MKTRCRRGHIKVRGKNCRACQRLWENAKYRRDPEYQERKKAAGRQRYAKQRQGENHA